MIGWALYVAGVQVSGVPSPHDCIRGPFVRVHVENLLDDAQELGDSDPDSDVGYFAIAWVALTALRLDDLYLDALTVRDAVGLPVLRGHATRLPDDGWRLATNHARGLSAGKVQHYYDLAENALHRAIELNPGNPMSHLLLGILLESRGLSDQSRIEQAIEQYELAFSTASKLTLHTTDCPSAYGHQPKRCFTDAGEVAHTSGMRYLRLRRYRMSWREIRELNQFNARLVRMVQQGGYRNKWRPVGHFDLYFTSIWRRACFAAVADGNSVKP